jgi:cell division protein ZapA (FtsZ GTPase activity inhibitor)
MSEFSINVSIAGRTYPLTIQREEEEYVRKAAQLINDNVKSLQQNYAVKDAQDLLAMTALEYSSELILKKGSVEQDKVLHQLEQLDQKLSSYLATISQ